jgi:hypothetical protein
MQPLRTCRTSTNICIHISFVSWLSYLSTSIIAYACNSFIPCLGEAMWQRQVSEEGNQRINYLQFAWVYSSSNYLLCILL